MKTGDKFANLAKSQGLSVSKALQLGKYLHVEFTRSTDEQRLYEMLGHMKPSKIVFLKPAADGQHLDGSKNHKLCAIF